MRALSMEYDRGIKMVYIGGMDLDKLHGYKQ